MLLTEEDGVNPLSAASHRHADPPRRWRGVHWPTDGLDTFPRRGLCPFPREDFDPQFLPSGWDQAPAWRELEGDWVGIGPTHFLSATDEEGDDDEEEEDDDEEEDESLDDDIPLDWPDEQDDFEDFDEDDFDDDFDDDFEEEIEDEEFRESEEEFGFSSDDSEEEE